VLFPGQCYVLCYSLGSVTYCVIPWAVLRTVLFPGQCYVLCYSLGSVTYVTDTSINTTKRTQQFHAQNGTFPDCEGLTCTDSTVCSAVTSTALMSEECCITIAIQFNRLSLPTEFHFLLFQCRPLSYRSY